MLAELDQRALRPRQRHPAPQGVPGDRGSLARAAFPGAPDRDRRHAEDPRPRHRQARAVPHAAQVPRHRLGPEPALPQDLRGGIRPVRRRALRHPRRRLPVRPSSGRRAAAGRHGQDRRRRACAVPDRRRAERHADGELARAGQPARPDPHLPDAGIRRLARHARRRGHALSRPVHAAHPRPPALRQPTATRSTIGRSRRRPTGRTPATICG